MLAIFNIDNDDCDSSILNGGATCQIIISPKASSDGAYSASLELSDGNLSVTASLDGTGSNFLVHGLVYAWGNDGDGQLGNGSISGDKTSPVPIAHPNDDDGNGTPAPLEFTTITAGYEDSCAITSAGTAYCWGANNYNRLGTGNGNDRNRPTAVNTSNVSNFSSISAQIQHSCGLSSSGAGLLLGAQLLRTNW